MWTAVWCSNTVPWSNGVAAPPADAYHSESPHRLLQNGNFRSAKPTDRPPPASLFRRRQPVRLPKRIGAATAALAIFQHLPVTLMAGGDDRQQLDLTAPKLLRTEWSPNAMAVTTCTAKGNKRKSTNGARRDSGSTLARTSVKASRRVCVVFDR